MGARRSHTGDSVNCFVWNCVCVCVCSSVCRSFFTYVVCVVSIMSVYHMMSCLCVCGKPFFGCMCVSFVHYEECLNSFVRAGVVVLLEYDW